jgi:hypothetical protein
MFGAFKRGVDIGAHTGWTTMHIMAAGCSCIPVDPIYPAGNKAFGHRLLGNTHGFHNREGIFDETSNALFKQADAMGCLGADLFCIDGDHEPGKPLEDAINAAKHLAETGVIIFHDFTGMPVREAVQYLMAQGFHCRVYFTPHMIALCWRGDFTPPDHVPDPIVKNAMLDGRLKDFDFTRCK